MLIMKKTILQPANDQLIKRLFSWAQGTFEPLQSYATGLLASCMELTDIAANFKYYPFFNKFQYFYLHCLNFCREDNNKLVPLVLERLQESYTQFCEENKINSSSKPFSHLNNGQTNDNTSIKPSPKKRSIFFFLFST